MNTTHFMTRPKPEAPARRNPVLQVGYAVDDVWAAAVLADQVNAGYIKDTEYRMDEDGLQHVVREANRTIVMDILQNHPERITDDLRIEGMILRDQLAQDLTLRTLKGVTTDFDNSVRQVLAVEDRMYTVGHRFEMAVIPSLPRSMRESVRRADVDAVLRGCTTLSAVPNSKVELAVRVVKSFYSKNYNVYFVTAVTEDHCAVMFPLKENFAFNTDLKIRGNVRDHQSTVTRLNRVKVLT